MKQYKSTEEIRKIIFSLSSRILTLFICVCFITILWIHTESAADKVIRAICAALSIISTVLLWVKSRYALYAAACFLTVLAIGSVFLDNIGTHTVVNQFFRYGLCVSLFWFAFCLIRFGNQLAKS